MEKAMITNTVTRRDIYVLFNPEEYTVNSDVNFAQTAVPGLSTPILQFVSGNMKTLEMELFLDTYEAYEPANRSPVSAGSDVRELASEITNLMNIDPTTHAPPVLIFTWASFSFTCVLARVSQRFTMFKADGTPVRARLQATFNEFRNVDLEAKETKRETANYSETTLVGQGERLTHIAARAYGNPQLWRPIALRNKIDDPRALVVGQRLLIPRLPFRDPETGEVFRQ